MSYLQRVLVAFIGFLPAVARASAISDIPSAGPRPVPAEELAQPLAPASTLPSAAAETILTTPGFWGDDLAAALPYLGAWVESGKDSIVAILPGRIQGHTPIRDMDSARLAAGRLAEALDRRLAARGLARGALRFHPEIVISDDDGLPRVAWGLERGGNPRPVIEGSLAFLRAGLKTADVMVRLGGPERTSELLIQSDSDRRPVRLTLYSYAGGAISFAESDFANEPGLVDRVLVNISVLSGAHPPNGGLPADAVTVSAAPATAPTAASMPALPADTLGLVDVATDDTDPRNLGDTEPSIAVNPANPLEIAVVSFSERWSDTAKAPIWKSSDGGATWRKVFQIPSPQPGSGGPGDQKIAFDGTGRLYAAQLGGGNWIFRQASDDPDADLVPGMKYGSDQPHLEVDKSAESGCSGQVYTPWLNTGTAQSTVSFSSDRGDTLTDVAVGDHAFPNRTTRIAVTPSGAAYVVYKTREGTAPDGFEFAHFRVARSDDCGATWSGLGDGGVSVHGADQVMTWFTSNWGVPGRKMARARSSDAWIATSAASESVYAVYVNRTDSGFGQVFLARSDDSGATWTSTQVTDDTHHAAYPEVAVTDNGAVGVQYIDYEDTGDAAVFRHHFAMSPDGGFTWSDEVLQAMDPAGIPNASNGFLWGDYEGLTAVGNTFYGIFTGESIGRSMTQLDPIFYARSATPNAVTTEADR